jgi:hypothetical protein
MKKSWEFEGDMMIGPDQPVRRNERARRLTLKIAKIRL